MAHLDVRQKMKRIIAIYCLLGVIPTGFASITLTDNLSLEEQVRIYKIKSEYYKARTAELELRYEQPSPDQIIRRDFIHQIKIRLILTELDLKEAKRQKRTVDEIYDIEHAITYLEATLNDLQTKQK